MYKITNIAGMMLLIILAKISFGADFYVNQLPFYITSKVSPYTVKVALSTYQDQNTTLEGDVVIPATVYHNGVSYTVTQIDGYAFAFHPKVTSWTIPSTVIGIAYLSNDAPLYVDAANPKYKSIDGVLFSKDGTRLISYPRGSTSVSYTLPETVTNIWYGAFWGCDYLEYVSLSENLSDIGEHAFSGCSKLSMVRFPATSLRTIGASAFAECNLTDVAIPQGVTHIGIGAFSSYDKLASITIPASVVSIADEALTDVETIIIDPQNKYYCTDNGILFNKNKTSLIRYPTRLAATSYTVPSTVKRIDNQAFYDVKALTSIILPQGLEYVGERAFYGCKNLEKISIPRLVNFGQYQFYIDINNSNFKAFEVDPAHASLKSVDGILYNKSGTVLLSLPQGKSIDVFYVPANVKKIEEKAFEHSSDLTKVVLNDGLQTIGEAAFLGCSNLAELNLPGSLQSIDDYAFWFTKLHLNFPPHIKLGEELFIKK